MVRTFALGEGDGVGEAFGEGTGLTSFDLVLSVPVAARAMLIASAVKPFSEFESVLVLAF